MLDLDLWAQFVWSIQMTQPHQSVVLLLAVACVDVLLPIPHHCEVVLIMATVYISGIQYFKADIFCTLGWGLGEDGGG